MTTNIATDTTINGGSAPMANPLPLPRMYGPSFKRGYKPLLIDGTLFIDNSSFDYMITCDRSAEFAILYKRKGAGQKAALSFGGGMHSALEQRGLRENTFTSDRRAELEAIQAEVLVKHFEQFPAELEDYRNLDYAIAGIQKYNQTYPLGCDDYKVALRGDGSPMVESSFAVPLGRIAVNMDIDGVHRDYIDVVWIGRIDTVIIKDGQFWVRDYKTSSIFGSKFFDDFLLSGQMMGYTWAMSKVLGKPVAGALVDALICRKPTRTGTAFEFGRSYIPFTPARLERWQINTLTVITDFFHHLKAGYFPEKCKWCNGKYGSCQYKDICQQEPEFHEATLFSGLFANNDWSPLKEKQ